MEQVPLAYALQTGGEMRLREFTHLCPREHFWVMAELGFEPRATLLVICELYRQIRTIEE